VDRFGSRLDSSQIIFVSQVEGDMGSIGEHTKGETPFLDRIKAHNDHYDQMLVACHAAAPLYLKLLAKIGIWQPIYNWQSRNQFKYWPDDAP
jgi:hypothetical protein